MELGVCAAYARARALGELEALRQRLRVEGRRLGSQGGERGLRWVLRGGLDHAVQAAQAAQHAVDAQLRASSHGRHEPAHPGQRGAAQTVRSQTPTQAVQQGLAEGGGALMRGRSALEGEGGATAGQTTREQLLEDRIFMHDRIHCLCT